MNAIPRTSGKRVERDYSRFDEMPTALAAATPRPNDQAGA